MQSTTRSAIAMSRGDALEDISSWASADVVELLQKNGVDEACWKAAEKRQIDGDELLHLTEGKLALWKSDLTKSLIWKLWTFVEELKKRPEKYVEQRNKQQQPSATATTAQSAESQPAQPVIMKSGALSDASSWDTDFDDDEDEPETSAGVNGHATTASLINSDEFLSRLRIFQENDRVQRQKTESLKGSNFSLNRMERSSNGEAPPTPRSTSTNSNAPPTPETTYANCLQPDGLHPTDNAGISSENTYMNCTASEVQLRPQRNETRLHSAAAAATHQQQKTLADKLREQLMMLGVKPTRTAVASKSGDPCKARDGSRKEANEQRIFGEPRTSFLHRNAGAGCGDARKARNAPSSRSSASDSVIGSSTPPSSCSEESLRNLPRPPSSIQSFDLVANLPSTKRRSVSDEDDDDDDGDDDADDGDDEESYESFDQRIAEQHRPPSAQSGRTRVSRECGLSSTAGDDEDIYELYESITETPEDEKRARTNNTNASPSKVPPPLPVKPPRNVAAERSANSRSTGKPGTSPLGARRPLPLPPDPFAPFHDRPWFHNLTREQAIVVIEQRKTDGCFLLRPSTTNPDNPMTLVLWFKDKVYNIPVRRRPDKKFALGTPKSEEQAFDCIDDIVPYFKSESLVLSSGGVEMGSTKLTDTPPKEIQ